MKILHILPSTNPLLGGTVEAVRQSGAWLCAAGHTVDVLSLDDPGEAHVAAFSLPVHAIGPSAGHYRYNSRLVPWLRANAQNYDAVIVNGLWQYHSFGAWRALRRSRTPYFVFTHGMLDPWFKRTYPLKHLKKWLYWPWSEYRLLRDASAVLFTSEEERLLSRDSFWLYRAKEHIVPCGTASPPAQGELLRDAFFARHPQLRGKRLMLFLSRVHPKKGCDLLIEAFARRAQAHPDWQLVVAGPESGNLGERLRARASELGLSERITWTGMLEGNDKWAAFYASDVFVLPSHQENFGIVIAEALACQLPVLITNKVNIWREVLENEAGFVSDDTVDGVEHSLDRWLRLKLGDKQRMKARAQSLYESHFTVKAMAHGLIDAVERFA
jgi:glycosyltransferase involved in cell wall biosynthesis